MNHIARVSSTKFESSSRNIESPRIFERGSWRSRAVVKMKECRDAIKNTLLNVDKSSYSFESARRAVAAVTNRTSLSSIDTGLKTSVSSLSDILRRCTVAFKDKELGSVEIRRRNSMSNSPKKEPNVRSTSRFPTSNDATDDDSIDSFPMPDNQPTEPFLREEQTFTIKKKISAEPFLSYVEGTAEFVWTDDTEASLYERASNYANRSNTSDIDFENPPFRELDVLRILAR